MSDAKDPVDRPAKEPTEIEVTPEMIEAGRDVISSVWMDFTGPKGELLWDSVLSRVYLAMRAVRLESHP
jgi:hypothetical protein